MKLSIITINLNNKEGLRNTINSIISQTYKDYEWIVIDGGSTDGSRKLIEENRQFISYWVSEPDKGIYDAMNKGIRYSHGDYALFMNSGDTLCSKNVIEKILNINDLSQYDILTGHTYCCVNGVVKRKEKAPPRINVKLFMANRICHQSTLIRLSHLKNNGGYNTNYKIISDMIFFFEDLIFRKASYKPLNFYISNYDLKGISIHNQELNISERNAYFNSIIPPAIIHDYDRLIKGETRLERIINRIEEDSLFYKWMTLVATISYLPRYLIFKIRRI